MGVGESDYDFLARPSEEALRKSQNICQPQRAVGKKKFISGSRDPEAKIRLRDGIKAKPAMSVTEMTEILQFRS